MQPTTYLSALTTCTWLTIENFLYYVREIEDNEVEMEW
jgi:hypothetical protein